MKKLFTNLFVLLLLLGGGFFAFINYVDSDTKTEVYETLGIEEGSALREAALDTYLEVSEITANQNLAGKWVIRGWMRNTHPSRTIEQVSLRIRFSDGNETRTIAKSLNPEGMGVGKPFTIKISGHTDAEFQDWKVISAK